MEIPPFKNSVMFKTLNEKYRKYKIPDISSLTMDDVCNTKGPFKLQPQQELYADYISPSGPGDKFLVNGKPGTGKTCVSVSIAEHFIDDGRHIFVSVPAPLIDNYVEELKTACATHNYVFEKARRDTDEVTKKGNPKKGSELDNLVYMKLKKDANKTVETYYTITTHATFPNIFRKMSKKLKKPPVIIIDEIQKLASSKGKTYDDYFRLLRNDIHKDSKVICLSGTPIMDKAIQIGLIMNLLLPDHMLFDIKTFETTYLRKSDKNIITDEGVEIIQHDVINEDDLLYRFYGHIGFFQGLGRAGFVDVTRKFVDVEMSNYQANLYSKIHLQDFGKMGGVIDVLKFKPKNNFYQAARQASNLVYPNGEVGKNGSGLTDAKLKDLLTLQKLSCKAFALLKLFTTVKFPAFVYSGFLPSGVDFLGRVFVNNGYRQLVWDNSERFPKLIGQAKVSKKKDIVDQLLENDQQTFVVLSGEEDSKKLRDFAIKLYLDKRNMYGKLISIIFGSSVLQMGFSLKRTRTEVIFDPNWNWPLTEQIEQRGDRFCGFQDVPEKDRSLEIYYFRSILNEKDQPSDLDEPLITAEQLMYIISDQKRIISNKFQELMWRASVDCETFKNVNTIVVKDQFKRAHQKFTPIQCYRPPDRPPPGFVGINTKDILDKITKQTDVRFSRNGLIPNPIDLSKLIKWIQYSVMEKQADIGGMNIHGYATSIEIEKDKNLANKRAKILQKEIKDSLTITIGITPPAVPLFRALAKVLVVEMIEDIDSDDEDVDEHKPPKTNKMIKIGGKIDNKTRGKVVPGCPANRRPNDKGSCPVDHPYKRSNPKGHLCCYKKPGPVGAASSKIEEQKTVKVLGDFMIHPDRGLLYKNRKCMTVNKREIADEITKLGGSYNLIEMNKGPMCKAIEKFVERKGK